MDSRARFSVYDVHVHIHPQASAAFLRVMDANHIERVVNLGTLEVLAIPFEEGMRVYREAMGERMVYFWTPSFGDVSPGFGKRMADELERRVTAGAGGLKIFKELGLRHRDAAGNLIPVDDERLDPLWERAGGVGVPVLIHTADPVAFFQPLNEANERWEELQARPDWHFGGPGLPDHDTLLKQRNRVIERHAGTTFIGAHLGNYPESLAYVDGCLGRFSNFHVDTSARIGEIGRHPVEATRAFLLKHANRVLFGTDQVVGWSPGDGGISKSAEDFAQVYDAHWRFFETNEVQVEYPGYPIQGRWKVDALGIPDQVLEQLYYRNAQRVIPALRR